MSDFFGQSDRDTGMGDVQKNIDNIGGITQDNRTQISDIFTYPFNDRNVPANVDDNPYASVYTGDGRILDYVQVPSASGAASGDILYWDATLNNNDGGWKRLPKGANGKILEIASDIPSWQTKPTGLPSGIAGDITYFDTSWTILSKATSLKWLESNNGNPSWGSPMSGFSNFGELSFYKPATGRLHPVGVASNDGDILGWSGTTGPYWQGINPSTNDMLIYGLTDWSIVSVTLENYDYGTGNFNYIAWT